MIFYEIIVKNTFSEGEKTDSKKIFDMSEKLYHDLENNAFVTLSAVSGNSSIQKYRCCFGGALSRKCKRRARKKYMEYKAKKVEILFNDTLFNGTGEEKAFTADGLSEKFALWYSNYVRTEMYPQYAEVKKKITTENENRFGKALKDLDEMVGLSNAKKVIYNALDYYKVQKLYKQLGKKLESPSMHMVFTGNPGTAKTTVARLFAQILKDNDIIKNGRLVEVGRADLVGKYVGHTAPLVKRAFDEAEGGVLFIDEAYSLVDDRSGLFGDEAINTIVQEMENRRNETIVIFAGYPNEMERFLVRNPGFKSRI